MRAKMVYLSAIVGMMLGSILTVFGIGLLVKTDLEEME